MVYHARYTPQVPHRVMETYEVEKLGKITDTEVVFKDGTTISLSNIGKAEYKSHYFLFWIGGLIIVIIAQATLSLLVLILFMAYWFFYPYSVLRIENKHGGQVYVRRSSYWNGPYGLRTFAEEINRRIH